jgi:hypothetical protein
MLVKELFFTGAVATLHYREKEADLRFSLVPFLKIKKKIVLIRISEMLRTQML